MPALDALAIEPLGDAACVVEWPEPATDETAARARDLADLLDTAGVPGLLEVIPAFRSCAVHFDPLVTDHEGIGRAVAEALKRRPDSRPAPQRQITIPVVYGGEYGPDLEAVAAWAGLDPDKVVRLHTGAAYTCVMLGFICAFPYLSGVPPAIQAPRLASPRTRVPAGSVGVAGPQGGIYPVDSPGGWRILGRTPVTIWDPLRDPPALFRPGDRVRFVAVSAAEFASAEVRVEDPARRG